MYHASAGLGDATSDLRAQAQAEASALTHSITQDLIAIAALRQQGNTAGADAVQARMVVKQARRNALNAFLDGSELSATDRAILATGGYIGATVDAAGNIVKGAAGGIGDITGSLLKPLLVPLGIVAAIVVLSTRRRK